METYHGHVKTPADAIILFEACRLGHLPRVQRRLSEKERQQIRSGSVFVWDEREAGMRRWTDGKSWSASRVSGSFLTYREMEGKRGGSNFSSPMQGVTQSSSNGAAERSVDVDIGGTDGPDGYRYKPDGLMKQSFSITTSRSQHLHLISYYARSDPSSSNLTQPTNDPALRSIRPEKGMYPESTMHDAPAVTRSPMTASPYTTSPRGQLGPQQQNYLRHPPPMHQPSYGWPPSPAETPPTHYGHQHQSPYQHQHNGLPAPPPPPPPPAPGSSNPSPMYYNRPYQPQVRQSGLTALDRAPPPMGASAIPPPPPPPPQTHSYYPQSPVAPPNYQQPQSSASAPSYPPPPLSYPHHLSGLPTNHTQSREGAPQYNSSPYAPVNPYSHSTNPNTVNIDPRLSAPHPQQQQQQQPQQQQSSQAQQPPLPPPPPPPQQPPSQNYVQPKYELPPPPSPHSSAPDPQNQLRNGASASSKTIPSIGALINPASPQMPPPSASGLDRAPGATRLNSHGKVEMVAATGPQNNGQGSIGSKMGFGEDSRLLRQLDRAFAA